MANGALEGFSAAPAGGVWTSRTCKTQIDYVISHANISHQTIHRGLNEMADILQMTYSNVFSWMETMSIQIILKFVPNSTIDEYLFR